MKIVTSGPKFMDIDGYAGCIAYAELLRLRGFDAKAASAAPLNYSITPTLRALPVQYDATFYVGDEDAFIIVDISDPQWLDSAVSPDRVEAVIDHHVGFEKYWGDRLGNGAHIEFIGAACTLVYERFKLFQLEQNMSKAAATLLAAGILDNTLDFRANVTTHRDKTAYAKLQELAGLPNDWDATYFAECQQHITKDIAKMLEGDIKELSLRSLPQESVHIGQLAVWNAKEMLKHSQDIQNAMAQHSNRWLVNLISIQENASYFLSDNSDVQRAFAMLLGIQFDDNSARANRLWLCKEIVKADYENAIT